MMLVHRAFVAALVAVLCASPASAQDSFGQSAPPQKVDPSRANVAPSTAAQSASPKSVPRPQAKDNSNLDQLMQMERQEFGIAPTKQLHAGPMHAPTPASIPGGQLITTKGLAALVQDNAAPYVLFDVLGGAEILPGALQAAWFAQGGTFSDAIQQQFSQYLAQETRGSKDVPLVFYCLSNHCWMSYNAALRAINLGYTNVLWYRGGIEAWKMAGMRTATAQSGYDR